MFDTRPSSLAKVAALSCATAALVACTPSRSEPAVTDAAAASASSASTAKSTRPTVAVTTSRPTPRLSSVQPATRPSIPPVSAAARAVGFVDVRTIVPDAVIDLRYATSHNFVGVQLYPTGARCLVHESMADGLRIAADELRRAGYLLVFWDCYRPHDVQVRMYQVVSNPDWVARPGPYSRSHETGRSVDVTLAHVSSSCPVAQQDHLHCLLDMGTGFDDFTDRAHAFSTDGITAVEQVNRSRLRSAMDDGGLRVYSGEWWHFDGPGAFVERPIVNVPVD